MKIKIIEAIAVSLPLMLGTAVADESDPLRMAGGLDAAPLTDQELGVVNGGYPGYRHRYYGEVCRRCSNDAYVMQANLSHFSAFVHQGNGSYINQENN